MYVVYLLHVVSNKELLCYYSSTADVTVQLLLVRMTTDRVGFGF